MSPIKDEALYLKSQVNWAILDGCFPGRIRPSDLDGVVEIDGCLLYFEHKLPGAELSNAMRWLFRAAARQGNTCIAFWSDGPDHLALQEIKVWGPNGFQTFQDKDLEFLRDLVRGWVASVRPRRSA